MVSFYGGHLESWLKIQMAQSMVKFIALKKSQFVTKIYGFSKKSLKNQHKKLQCHPIQSRTCILEVVKSLGIQPKVGCVIPMVIWSELRLGKYRDDDHREDAPHFRMNGYFRFAFSK